MQKPVKKKTIVEPLEALDDQNLRSSGKEPLPVELAQKGAEPLKKKKKAEADLLTQYQAEEEKVRQKHMRRLRQFKSELIAAQTDLEKQEEERKKRQEEEKKRREGEEMIASGEEALAQTGATQKRPTGLFGIGGKFKKLYKWFTAERKGRAPK